MYEKKNEQLDHDLQHLQDELDRAKDILKEVDLHWNEGGNSDLQVKSIKVSNSLIYFATKTIYYTY